MRRLGNKRRTVPTTRKHDTGTDTVHSHSDGHGHGHGHVISTGPGTDPAGRRPSAARRTARLLAVALTALASAVPAHASEAPAPRTPAPVPTVSESEAADTLGTGQPRPPGWRSQDSGVTVRLRGLAAVDRRTAWAAGSRGTVLRTTDGGAHWRTVSPPGTADLEFRDIEAFDARRAVVLAIGEGEASRMLRTDDGGATWTEVFRNTDPRAFYDCVAFFDDRRGLAMSDPVDGKYRIVSTRDGGRSWRVLPDAGMPPALPGEAGFAASGQCLVTSGSRDVWLATGGGARARVLRSTDRGHTWRATELSLPAGDPARGVFALAFRDSDSDSSDRERDRDRDRGRDRDRDRAQGIAVGGDYRTGQPSPDAAATTRDGGRSWRSADRPPPAYRSGAVWLPAPWAHRVGSRHAALAVGPTGTDLTTDGGRTWRPMGTGSYDTVDCAPDGGCWASGEKGRVARLTR
ncbi:YCF48-related protein [Streptomyces uncialis]|uniref:YCF48-related protein n=1 Tax=Streptomyces uncialis TaxID=1048205 RepID=UPI000AE3421C|nr:oxidoreductase [Streptomyces uncialis]